jgi:hypothetical protein
MTSWSTEKGNTPTRRLAKVGTAPPVAQASNARGRIKAALRA